jgi:membrane protein
MQETDMSKIKQWFSNTLNLLKGTAKKFSAEDGSLIAAAISFYSLLSLLPLLLLAVSALGYVMGGNEKAYGKVIEYFNNFMPNSTFITNVLRDLVRARGVVGLVGLVALLWTGSQLFTTLQTALNDVWEVVDKPGFIKARVKSILVVILFGVLLILSIASSSLVGVIKNQDAVGLGFISSGLSKLLGSTAVIAGLIFAVAMFFVVYKILPNTNVHWKPALYGAIFTGIVWVIVKELYRLYLENFADYNKLYGSLGSVIILVIWIYYSSMIMVFGAELAYVKQHGPEDKPEEKERMEK